MSITKMRRGAAPVSTFVLAAFLAAMIPPRVAQADPLAPIPDGTGGAKSAGQPLQPAADVPRSDASVDLSTGSARSSYPFKLQTARGQAQPSLGLTYDSAAGVGLAGVGWTLNVPSITRQGVAGYPSFVDWMNLGITPSPAVDSFVIDGLHLVPICKVSGNACNATNGPSGEVFPNSVNGYYYFRKEVDDDVRYFFSPDGRTWIVQTKSGHTLVFGNRLGSDTVFSDGSEALPTNSVFPPGPSLNHPIYKWHLIRDTDATGNNTVYYVYDTLQSLLPSGVQNDGMLYLTDIYDTPMVNTAVQASAFAHRTHLQWELPGPSVSAIVDPVWRALPFARVKRVDITSYPTTLTLGPRQAVRSYSMSYQWNDWQTQFYLSEIDAAGNLGPSPGFVVPEPAAYTTTLPILTSTSYRYSGVSGATQPVLPKVVTSTTTRGVNTPSSIAGPTYEYIDVDQDGKADFVSGPYPVNPNDPNSPQEFSLQASRVTNAVLTLSSQNASTLQATLANLAPGAPQTISADWLGTGQLQLLWMNINPSSQIAQPEIYNVDVPSGALVGSSVQYSSQQLPPDFNSSRSVDVDGDGLPDMTLIKTSGSGFETLFSARDRSGALSPFNFQTVAACGTPAMDQATYGNDTFRTMADMDGDGLPDLAVVSKAAGATSLNVHVLTNRGTGAFGAPSSGCVDPVTGYSSGAAVSPTGAPLGSALSGDRMDASLIRFGDLNGDHLADFAVLSPHGLGICLRYGNSLSNLQWGCTNLTLQQLGQTGSTIDVRSWQLYLADVAGTGTLQVVYEPPNTQATALSMTGPPVGLLTDIKTTEGAESAITYALQGRGQNPTDSDWVPVPIWAVSGISTTNGLTNGLLAHSHAMSYSYQHPVYDPVDRVFAGFTTVTESEIGSSTAGPGLTRTTIFGTAPCVPVSYCLLESTHSSYRAVRDLPVVIQESSDSLHQFRTTWNEYKVYDLYNGADQTQTLVMRSTLYQQHIYAWDAQQTPQQIEVGWLNGGSNSHVFATIPVGGKEIRRQRNVDPFDNEVSVVDFGVVGVDEPIMESRTWQLPIGDQTGWSYRAVKSQTGYTDATGSTFTEPGRLYFFDYYPSGLLETVAGTLAGTLALPGPPGQSRAAPVPTGAASDGLLVLSSITYDAYGNPSQTLDGAGHCVGLDYDTTFSQLPSHRSVFRGGCGVNPLTTTEVIDRIFEQPTMVMTPAGRVTQYQYNDSFGRLTEIDQQAVGGGATLGMASTSAAVKVSYLADQTTVRTIVVQTADGTEASPTYHTHSEFIDSFGDPIVTFDDSGPAGGTQNTISGVHIRDSYGRIMQVYQPYTVPTSAAGAAVFLANSLSGPSTSFMYDGLGRVVQVTDPNGFVSRKVYRGAELSVDSYDAEQQAGQGHYGAMSTVTSDGHGRIVESRSHLVNATQGSGDFVVDAAYQSTGEPYEITQTAPTGSLTRWMQYDSLGRMVFNAEPNTSTGFSPTVGAAGVRGWTYAYDASSQLVGSSDARGCGENIAYDGAGRRVSEDFSGCDPSQTYSSPQANGDGTEAFYVYDTVTPGDLAEVDDRGARTKYSFDLRGRVTSIQRQIATPTGSDTLAKRYASTTFTKNVAYSAANMQLTVSTGANASALMVLGGSTMTYAYTNDGRLQSLMSSYGPLVSSATYDASGALTNEVLGDVAATTIDAGYDGAESLQTYWVHRRAGPWKASIPLIGYQPPATGSYELQADLTHLVYGYDHVYNPVQIGDAVNDSGISAGLKPANRALTYGDDYRISRIQTTYGLAHSTDAYNDPPYAPERARGSKLYPQPPTQPATRVADQHVAYDWFGNTSSTTDELSVTPDRSLGSITNGTATSSPNHFVHSLSTKTDGVEAAYDAAGNTTQVNVTLSSGPTTLYAYGWDELGRLSSATRTDSGALAVQEKYAYDASSQRVLVDLHDPVANTDTCTLQVFDSLALKGASFNTTTGYQDDATTEQLYLSGGGVLTHVRYEAAALPVGSGTAGQVHEYMTVGDPQGSASFVIEHDTGELVEHPTYYAYGGAESDFRSARWNNLREDVRYSGHWDDAEVGLVYFGARYYSPLLDRWISADPLTVHGLGADPNPYAFVGGSPIGSVDPLGLCADDGFGKECPPTGAKTNETGPPGDNGVGISIPLPILGAGLLIAAAPVFVGLDLWDPSFRNGVTDVVNGGAKLAQDVGKAENSVVKSILGLIFGGGGGGSPAPPPPIDNSLLGIFRQGDAQISASLQWWSQALTHPCPSNVKCGVIPVPGPGLEALAAEEVGAASKALVPYYPANNGFLGATSTIDLQAGQIIDRAGGSAVSRFFSPAGTPLAARALPPDVAGLPLRSFQVARPFGVQAGTVAPAFGQLGLGTQFRTALPLQELLDQGFLLEVTP
jgi:RHS repeat-associated protein